MTSIDRTRRSPITPRSCTATRIVEFPLFRREADVQVLLCGEDDTVSFPDDAELLLQDASIDESAPNLFAAFPRHNDTPHTHDSAIPRLAVKDFRIQTNPSCWSSRRSQARDYGGKENSPPAILTPRWGNSCSSDSGWMTSEASPFADSTRHALPIWCLPSSTRQHCQVARSKQWKS